MLAIDPSSGGSSLPGYSIWESGSLCESGLITVQHHTCAHKRNREIAEIVQNFGPHDILIIEQIRKINAGKYSILPVKLLWSCGVIGAAANAGEVIEIRPQVWRKYIPEGYFKSDMNDAVMLGWAAIQIALGTEDIAPLKILEYEYEG